MQAIRDHGHRAEATDREAQQEWFAAAFHLRQLLAAKEADALGEPAA